MTLNFTTLFNSKYLAKGVALIYSLQKSCPDFHLYVFAFDEQSYDILKKKNLSNTTVISPDEFETQSLLSVKETRSVAEYCWTCTPFTIKYCLDKFNLSNCTYVDADTFFYSDPGVLIKEMGDNSVLITPHNYHPNYDQSAAAGIYCVQFITFKKNENGMKVLSWWADACLTWCYARYEDGKMGDQKYLDCWPYVFHGVYICRNQGAGLAPWNALSNIVESNNGALTVSGKPLIFYHFHDLKYLSDGSWYVGGYDIPQATIENIYKPYLKTLLEIDADLRKEHLAVDSLNITAIKNVGDLKLKFKTGLYILDLKRSFIQFFSALFFNSRRKYYKKNYIRIN
jgi:hypothetical protein